MKASTTAPICLWTNGREPKFTEFSGLYSPADLNYNCAVREVYEKRRPEKGDKSCAKRSTRGHPDRAG